MTSPVLAMENVTKRFDVRKGVLFSRSQGSLLAVDEVSFALERGSTFGLVGESGCGKTTLLGLLAGLEELTSGRILYHGRELSKLKSQEKRAIRQRIQVVFQDPFSSLNPRMKVGRIISEPLQQTSEWSERRDRARRIDEVLELVGLSSRAKGKYPSEFSGGQRQRIAIARALAPNPEVLLLDEPTSGLDVSIKAQILALLPALKEHLGLTLFFISHDLAAVSYVSDVLAVMYLGRIVEMGPTYQLLRDPLHPYTQSLFTSAQGDLEGPKEDMVRGDVPSALEPPPGCHFHPRCPIAETTCTYKEPVLRPLGTRMLECDVIHPQGNVPVQGHDLVGGGSDAGHEPTTVDKA